MVKNQAGHQTCPACLHPAIGERFSNFGPLLIPEVADEAEAVDVNAVFSSEGFAYFSGRAEKPVTLSGAAGRAAEPDTYAYGLITNTIKICCKDRGFPGWLPLAAKHRDSIDK
jgi:hypothetical protein